MEPPRWTAYASVILAASLFGASFPLSKPLVREAGPLWLAGLFYIGCGIGAVALRLLRRLRSASKADPPLARSDLKWLLGSTLSGGIVAPVLLLFGLKSTPAHVAAFLTNSETLFTVLLAVLFFGDRLTRREGIGTAGILLGATLVARGGAPGDADGFPWQGPLLLLGAGLGWGLDNNFTQRISACDPLQIAAIKGLVAGSVNLSLALATGSPASWGARWVAGALVLGFCCYGLSLFFFVIGLRHLGAARTSSLFATNPAMAVLLAWALLGEVPRTMTAAGGLLMIPAAWLLIRSQRSHRRDPA